MSDRLARLLAERPYLLADGATGTNLFDAGLASGDAPELWNVEFPERVEKLHRDMTAAGADIILTNSFGGSRYRLKLHKAEARVAELNERAARIARRVADEEGARCDRSPSPRVLPPSPSRPMRSPRAAPTSSGSRPCPRRTSWPPPSRAPARPACPSSAPSPSTPTAAP